MFEVKNFLLAPYLRKMSSGEVYPMAPDGTWWVKEQSEVDNSTTKKALRVGEVHSSICTRGGGGGAHVALRKHYGTLILPEG